MTIKIGPSRFVDFAATSRSRKPKVAAGSCSTHAHSDAGSSRRVHAFASETTVHRRIDVFLVIVSVSCIVHHVHATLQQSTSRNHVTTGVSRDCIRYLSKKCL